MWEGKEGGGVVELSPLVVRADSSMLLALLSLSIYQGSQRW